LHLKSYYNAADTDTSFSGIKDVNQLALSILSGFCIRAGWMGSLIIGGPDPERNGEIETIRYVMIDSLPYQILTSVSVFMLEEPQVVINFLKRFLMHSMTSWRILITFCECRTVSILGYRVYVKYLRYNAAQKERAARSLKSGPKQAALPVEDVIAGACSKVQAREGTNLQSIAERTGVQMSLPLLIEPASTYTNGVTITSEPSGLTISEGLLQPLMEWDTFVAAGAADGWLDNITSAGDVFSNSEVIGVGSALQQPLQYTSLGPATPDLFFSPNDLLDPSTLPFAGRASFTPGSIPEGPMIMPPGGNPVLFTPTDIVQPATKIIGKDFSNLCTEASREKSEDNTLVKPKGALSPSLDTPALLSPSELCTDAEQLDPKMQANAKWLLSCDMGHPFRKLTETWLRWELEMSKNNLATKSDGKVRENCKH